MSEWICPICGQKNCEKKTVAGGYEQCTCKQFGFQYFLSCDLFDEPDKNRLERIWNLITEYMLHSKSCHTKRGNLEWHFYDADPGAADDTPEYVNVSNLLLNYPEQVLEKAHRSLVNLSILFPHYGDLISFFPTQRRAIFEHEPNNSRVPGMLLMLEDLGYLKDPTDRASFLITAAGWQKIDELRNEEKTIRQGFIAMAFREDTKAIREAFRKAITESGYSVAVIDEKEHNNQIVPEIFYEIERSKFVVVDVTYPNYGAYYEAGYAQALGKQVIICCRKAEFDDKENPNRPHFDIAQKAMVVWENEDDLIQRLKRRIEATVK